MKIITILTAAASTMALCASAQVQMGDQNVMEPLVQGGLIDGGLINGEEKMAIDPDMMDRTPDYMPDTSARDALDAEGIDTSAPETTVSETEGEPATRLVPEGKIHMPYVKKAENGEPLPQPVDEDGDAEPQVMPKK